MTRDEARQAVVEAIQGSYRGREEIVVDDVRTLTKSYGWVFFYNSKRYLDRREPLHALGGNGPIVVESATGRITKLGTGRPVEDEIADFELRNGYRT